MKKYTLVLAVLSTLSATLSAQTANFFQPVNESAIELRSDAKKRDYFPNQYTTYRLDYAAMKNALQTAPMEFTPEARERKCLITIPLPDGVLETFSVWQTAVMEPALAAQYPNIRTFAGESVLTPGRTLRCMYSARGFRAVVLQPDLGMTYLEIYAGNQDEYYIAYDRKDWPEDKRSQLERAVAPGNLSLIASGSQPYTPPAEERGLLTGPVQLKVYRFAVGATSGFSADHGGTKETVWSAIMEYTEVINAIYERDADLRLLLIAASQNAIYLNLAIDPYVGTTVPQWADANTGILNVQCGAGSYDIGHVYAQFQGGPALGIGGLGVACGNSKGIGCSAGTLGGGGGVNYGDDFIFTVGQEVGHQMNGGHTWTHCGNTNGFMGQSATEPGAGTTIMSYSGICGSDNIQGYADLYFHSSSSEEFQKFYTNGPGKECGSIVVTDNNPPLVALPYQDNFFIPIRTPFEMNGSASDPNGDALTYVWEGIDTGPSVPLGTQEANSAIFRTYPSGTATNRYFPRLNTVLANATYNAEILPEYTRDVTLRFTARDSRPGGGGIAWADVAFKAWGNAGPFLVTWPNTGADIWRVGEYVNVTWNVANTDAAPVNCQKVNIRLSTDGGQTYPLLLASGVPNDGAHYLLVPNNLSNAARVRIDAADNVFFDLSNANFKIQQPAQPALSIGLSSESATLCLPNVFSTEVLTTGILGFNNPVTLEITGDLPPGAVAAFSKTTVNPGESSMLTVDLSNVVQEGVYTFNVQGTAPGSAALIRPVTLKLYSNDFSALALTSPADGSTGLDQSQVLRWNKAADALTYDVQFSLNPSFSTILTSVTATASDSFKVPILLNKSTGYYWRVRPRNECGIHDWTEPFFFSTFTDNCSVLSGDNLPKNLPTSGTPSFESKIVVNAGGTISDLNVTQLKGHHEQFKDLEVHLISPQGTDVILFNKKCGTYNGNFNFGLDDDSPNAFPCPPVNTGLFFRPMNPLSPFLGQNNTGTWTLRVKDNEVGSGGAFDVFKLEFCATVSLNPPYLVNNKPLTIQTGTNATITADLLLAEDANNTHAQLTYTLLTVPKYGLLDKDGVGNLKPGDQFTQSDLDAGKIRFYDFGTNGGQDGFRFTVSDGEGGFLATPKFIIQPLGVGAGEPAGESPHFTLFPNPAGDAVWLSTGRPAETQMRVSLLSVAGQLLQNAVLPAGAERLQLQLGGLPKGLYVVRVENAKGAGVRKLAVQ